MSFIIWVLIEKLTIPENAADDIPTDWEPTRLWYSAAGRVFCFRCYDEVRRSSRTVVRKPKSVYNIFYLARARILRVAKETAVFSFFFPFERFCYRCSLIHRVRLFGQSGTRTDASAALHFWLNMHTPHIIIRPRRAVPAIIITIITIQRLQELLWKSV